MEIEHKPKRYVMYQEIGHGDTYVDSTFLRDALATVSAKMAGEIKARPAEPMQKSNM